MKIESIKYIFSPSLVFMSVKRIIPSKDVDYQAFYNMVDMDFTLIFSVVASAQKEWEELETKLKAADAAPARDEVVDTSVSSAVSMTKEEFWNTIRLIEWRDSDERRMGALSIELSATKARYLSLCVSKLCGKLEEKSTETPLPFDLPHDTRIAFWSHVVGKGKHFYEACLEDLSLCHYMQHAYQDFLGALVAKAKK
jgi:hypothetical protein